MPFYLPCIPPPLHLISFPNLTCLHVEDWQRATRATGECKLCAANTALDNAEHEIDVETHGKHKKILNAYVLWLLVHSSSTYVHVLMVHVQLAQMGALNDMRMPILK